MTYSYAPYTEEILSGYLFNQANKNYGDTSLF